MTLRRVLSIMLEKVFNHAQELVKKGDFAFHRKRVYKDTSVFDSYKSLNLFMIQSIY